MVAPNLETPPPAPDYPPENAFDIASFTNQAIAEAKKLGSPAMSDEAFSDAIVKAILRLLALATKFSPFGIMTGMALVDDAVGTETRIITLLGTMLVKLAGGVMQPSMDILGELTRVYVNQFTAQQSELRHGTEDGHPTGLKPAAAGMFDSILAPIAGIFSAANPAKSGAGESNAQYALGSIVAIHLSTWAVNILSNLTGIGALKFINSFDDVITGALNSRSIGRLALRPYLTAFMADPLTRDLNKRYPLKVGYPTDLIRRYIRGAMTQGELKDSLRGLGYDDEVAADLLLSTVKFLGLDDLVWLFNTGQWTFTDCQTYLEHQGYPSDQARVAFIRQRNSLVDSQMRSLANSLVDAFIDQRITNEDLRYLLHKVGFTQEEENAMALRGATLQELPRRLSLSQVKQLYAASLLDLTYVLNYLKEEGYSDDDADLLALLEFTEAADRAQRKLDLQERRRVTLESQLGFAEAANRARAAELATLGGPTP